MSEGPNAEVSHLSGRMELAYWVEKAEENVEEWGLQEIETLLLAMQEEQGELSQAYLESEHEDGDAARIASELDDLAALCIQLRWRLEEL
jgi:NTP pyrophosphatase (non-canonical NTP hydrolase)